MINEKKKKQLHIRKHNKLLKLNKNVMNWILCSWTYSKYELPSKMALNRFWRKILQYACSRWLNKLVRSNDIEMNHFDMQRRQFVFSWKFNGVFNKKCPTFRALFDVSTFALFSCCAHFSCTLSCVVFIANAVVVYRLPSTKFKC